MKCSKLEKTSDYRTGWAGNSLFFFHFVGNSNYFFISKPGHTLHIDPYYKHIINSLTNQVRLDLFSLEKEERKTGRNYTYTLFD